MVTLNKQRAKSMGWWDRYLIGRVHQRYFRPGLVFGNEYEKLVETIEGLGKVIERLDKDKDHYTIYLYQLFNFTLESQFKDIHEQIKDIKNGIDALRYLRPVTVALKPLGFNLVRECNGVDYLMQDDRFNVYRVFAYIYTILKDLQNAYLEVYTDDHHQVIMQSFQLVMGRVDRLRMVLERYILVLTVKPEDVQYALEMQSEGVK